MFEHLRAPSGPTCGWRPSSPPRARPGTIAAGDRLKERYGAPIVAVEALECPTMLENGFGEHNIQGIGDKHVPLIHNVINTDVVVARHPIGRPISSIVLFNTDAGLGYLADRRRRAASRARALVRLRAVAASATCSAAIKTAKHLDLGPDDVDHHRRHRRRRDVRERARQDHRPTTSPAASTTSTPPRSSAAACSATATDDCSSCTERDRDRIFNLGYYTWVEQQGVPLESSRRAAAVVLARAARLRCRSGTR